MKDYLEAMSRTIALARDLISTGEILDADLAQAFRCTTVTLVADVANLESVAAQSALVTLFMLIARQGCTVRLRIPAVIMRGAQPPLRGIELQQSLIDFSRDLFPYSEVLVDDKPSDLTFVIGNTPYNHRVGFAWRLGANAWRGWISPLDVMTEPIQGDFPLGALTAAALAAVEPFKHSVRRLEAISSVSTNADFTRMVPSAQYILAPDGTPSTICNPLGEMDAISGGAITNAFLYTLLRVPGLSGSIRVIEPEQLDISNNNRYALARCSETGRDKVDILRQYATPLLAISGVKRRFTIDATSQLGRLAPRAMIGADDIPTRWIAQSLYPQWLNVGATSHFLTLTSSHEFKQGCAGCLHPHNELGPAIIPTASFVSFWAGLLMAARELRYIAGVPHTEKEQAIVFCPLQTDQANARIPYRVAINPKCPLHHAFSATPSFVE